MGIKKIFWRRFFSLVAIYSLLLNSLLPFFGSGVIFAQEATLEGQELIVSEPSPIPELETSPMPTPQEISSFEPSPTDVLSEMFTPTPQALETSPTPEPTPMAIPTPESNQALEVLQNAETKQDLPPWSFVNGVYTTETLRQDVVYKFPSNDKVTLKFNKLPEVPGKVAVREIALNSEQVLEISALSNIAYEITSTMPNGSFSYDLTLPSPQISTQHPPRVKYVESIENLAQTKDVEGSELVNLDTITVKNLNHFTLFVISGTIDVTGTPTGIPFDETNSNVVINEYVYNPSSGNEWIELYNKTNSDINLSGWTLEDSLGTTRTLSGAIPAKGLLVYENTGADIFNNTAANGNGDRIVLKQSGTVVDRVEYLRSASGVIANTDDLAPNTDNVLSGKSIGRTVDGSNDPTIWDVFSTPTKGWFNSSQIPSISAIVSQINLGGVTTNLGTLDNPSAAANLYFEKTGAGRVTFSATLNLTNQNTTTFLQNLGTKMAASAGSMKFDAQTAADLKNAGAEIKLYGLDALGYTVTPHLIVKDDQGNVIAPTDSSYPTLSISGFSGGTLTFTTNHFTQFDVDKDIYVDAANSGAEDGSQTKPFNTLQEGVNAAPTNGIVHAANGTYAENVAVTNKSNVTLQASGNNANIQPSSGIGIAITSSNGTSIKGFKIATSGTNAHGIWVAGTPSSGLAVTSLTIQDNSITVTGYSSGIYAEQTSSVPHSGWLIGGTGHGNTIVANPGSGTTGDGMDLYDVSASEVSSNTITLNSPTNSTNVLWTSELSDLANLKFLNNTVSGSSGSEIAILTDFQNLMPSNSITTVTITGNTFGNWGSRALRMGTANGSGTVSGITVSSNTFNMTADTTEVIGGTAAGSVTGTGNTFNVSGTAKIQKAINAARDGSGTSGDVIKVATGTYIEDLSISSTKTNLELSGTNSPTIKGVLTNPVANYPEAVPNIEILSSGVRLHGFTIEGPNFSSSTYASGMLIGAPNAEVYSNAFKVSAYSDGNTAMSNAIQTWHKNNKPSVDISGLNIHDNTFTSLSAQAAGYEGIYLNLDTGATVGTIKNNTFTGNIFRAITTERSKTTISNNTITNDLVPSGSSYSGTGGWQGINIGGANSGAISNIIVSGNTIQGSASNKGFSYGIKLGFTTSSTFANTSVTNNNVHNSGTAGVWNKITAAGVLVNNNDLSSNTKNAQNDDATVTLDATKNWWGSPTPDFVSILQGLINYNPWYTSSSKTTLSNNTSTDAAFTSTNSGQADLPSGVTSLALTNSTVMDVSGSLSTASGGSIYVKGATKTLSGYTGGDLNNKDLGAAQSIGGISMTIDKAVNLQSGTDTQGITLTNSNLTNVSVAIPDDTTVMGTSSWDGKITPPKAGDSSGTAPTGFSVGGTVIEVGSPLGILLFDQPVIITLSGVTGNVGYKPAGSTTWTQITTACGGSYTNPSKPTFPGECYISNGTDTKIYTYHFTTFGSLDTVSSSTSSSGGGTGGPSCGETKPGTPTLVYAHSTSDNEVELVWTDVSGPMTYYLVAFGDAPGSLKYGNPNIGGRGTIKYTVRGLSGDFTYYFRIRAGNSCMPGDFSNEYAVYVGGPKLSTPPQGFQEGVLGTKTDKEKEDQQGEVKAEIKEEKTPLESGTSNKIFLWVFLGTLLVAGAGGAIYLWYKKD